MKKFYKKYMNGIYIIYKQKSLWQQKIDSELILHLEQILFLSLLQYDLYKLKYYPNKL